MKFTNVLAAGAACCLATSPVVAQAATQPLPARTGAEVSEAENLGGGFLIPLLAIAAIILGILAVTGGDGDDLPTSP